MSIELLCQRLIHTADMTQNQKDAPEANCDIRDTVDMLPHKTRISGLEVFAKLDGCIRHHFASTISCD